mgnify:CR=1 FL=1
MWNIPKKLLPKINLISLIKKFKLFAKQAVPLGKNIVAYCLSKGLFNSSRIQRKKTEKIALMWIKGVQK